MNRNLFILTVISGFCFLLSPPGSIDAKDLTCDICGKEIKGQYYTYTSSQGQKLTVCLACERTLPHCNACKIPIPADQIIIYKGERLCPTCRATAKYCSLCQKRITGKYYQQENHDEFYCQRCYAMYPKCSVCGKPGPAIRLSGGKAACSSCLKLLPRCGSCGTPIIGQYFQYPSSDQKYCPDCQKDRLKCYTCGVPLGETSWKFTDGRRICHTCKARAVTDIDQIQAIVEDTKQLLARHLDLQITIPYSLQIKDLNKYSSHQADKAKNGVSNQSPLFGSELGLFRRMNGQAEIFILYGLPIEMLYETAAHELAHAWQSEHCPPDQSSELMEGFAQWVAAQILKIKGYNDALDRLEERKDPIYGGGYRKIKQLHENLGRQQLYQYVQSAK